MTSNLKNLLAFFFFLFLLGCKEEPKEVEDGIEQVNEVEVIEELTSSGRLEDFLEDEENFLGELLVPDRVLDFYKRNDFEPVWNRRNYRESFFRNLENIEFEGLFFEDYHGERLQDKLSSLDPENTSSNTELEILLTDAFLKLSHDLATGKLDPREIYQIWGTPVNTIDEIKLLEKAIVDEDFQEVLDSIRPKHVVYRGLKRSLEEFKKSGIEEDSATFIEKGQLIRPGETNTRIRDITFRLKELGFYQKDIDTSNQVYNKEIQEAISNYQKAYGLQTDGLLGNSTVESLNLTRRDRYHQLLVNLERWRWYPRDLGDHYIIINIPNFKLSLVKDGDTLRTHRTMVGTEARKTPIFSDEIQYIVYNPTWTIPPTIKKNDVIPGASRDISYLKKKNLDVYDAQGKKVDPSSIDWNSAKARTLTFRQSAGPTNPLGVVKIIYPNEYMIYLHDTPSKDLFQKNVRAQSSGCVRVQDALDLAEYLLNNQPKYDRDKISEIISSGKTTEIPVTKHVKVHHFYWTAFRENDSTKFIYDVYNLDKPLWEALKPKN